jgi:nickel-dependent lactate racemase
LNHSEFKYILGENISRVSIENHDPDDENRLIPIGRTSRDNLVKINRTFMEADFKILITDLDYHQFCGFGGGAKSVFPGLADRQSIEKNHARYNLPGCEKGEWLNNPIRQEIEEAGRMAKVDFLINVVLNNENKIAGIYAGDLEKAFLKGLDHLSAIFKKSIPEPADLVIASPGGYPLDINLYQAQKALQTASGIVEENAVIVLFAECIEGYGSEKFRKTVLAASGIDDIIKKHKEKFVLGAHKAYQFARELLHANIYLYSSLPENQVKELYLQPLRLEDMNKLIQAANKIVVLPYAVTTHVVVAES